MIVKRESFGDLPRVMIKVSCFLMDREDARNCQLRLTLLSRLICPCGTSSETATVVSSMSVRFLAVIKASALADLRPHPIDRKGA